MAAKAINSSEQQNLAYERLNIESQLLDNTSKSAQVLMVSQVYVPWISMGVKDYTSTSTLT